MSIWIYWWDVRILVQACDDFGFPAPVIEGKRVAFSLASKGVKKGQGLSWKPIRLGNLCLTDRTIPVAFRPMKSKVLAWIACLALTVVFSGCYRSVEGRTRAGMPLSKDRIESRYERSVDQLFAASKQVLGFNGTLTLENTINKTLEAKIDTNTVWIRVDEVEPNITRIIVQARKKGGTSNIALASEIDKQIALQLK
jgi:hypothetical protein